MGGGARNSESELKIPTVEPRIGYMKRPKEPTL
jgi:hypothetical protein